MVQTASPSRIQKSPERDKLEQSTPSWAQDILREVREMKNFLAVKCDDAKEAANLARQSSDDIKAALQTMEYRLEALEALTIHPKQRSQHPSESATQEPMDVEAEDEKMREHQGPAESFVSQRAQELNEQIERFRQVDTGALDDDAVLQHVLELSQAEAELERVRVMDASAPEAAEAALEMKLQDPHFVAQRCDLDSSGDLDLHELKQAARVFGVKLSPSKLKELMQGQERITKEDFAQIVVQLQPSSRRTVPHSLRGMTLQQLERLEEVFVTSGWLATECEIFNDNHAQAIREKNIFKQAPNLYALNTFVVTPMSKPGRCAARDQDHAQTVPIAYEETSFSELLNQHGLLVHCFVSHFWGHLFSKTLKALRLWADANYSKVAGQPRSMVFWICLFALNQHDVSEEVGDSPTQGPFNAALAQAECGAVLVLDEEINPFTAGGGRSYDLAWLRGN